jgi:ADP-ribose pyrophosphatase YjhB (NUDIX family)
MPASPYVQRLRRAIGHDVILLPTVTVLPRDDDQILLIRHSDHGQWATIGGSVEVDEHPETAAVREAKEEAGVDVEITRLVTALGGPDHRIRYRNDDLVSCVNIVYEARIISGTPRPDHDETTDVGWFSEDNLDSLDLGDFARTTFRALGL